jgi:uncharacterized Zn-finger protein
MRKNAMTTIESLGTVGAPDNGHPYPKFQNDRGVAEIRIGAKAFECIGETPPQDHPHVFLEMGESDTILCSYCSTLYCFDSGLTAFESDPADCQFRD